MKQIIYISALLLLVTLTYGQSETQEQEKKSLNPALLVIDMQKQFMPYVSAEDKDMALEMMNWAMWAFREHNLPVIRIYHTDPDWGPAPDSPMFEFHDSLKVKESDPKIVKTYPSSFTKTELDELLKQKNIHTLFLCGMSSIGCVLSTYMDAKSYDYKAFMIKDAMLSHSAEYTNNVEEMFSALDLETIMFMLELGAEK
jgi:nicotinamidase-related amidase